MCHSPKGNSDGNEITKVMWKLHIKNWTIFLRGKWVKIRNQCYSFVFITLSHPNHDYNGTMWVCLCHDVIMKKKTSAKQQVFRYILHLILQYTQNKAEATIPCFCPYIQSWGRVTMTRSLGRNLITTPLTTVETTTVTPSYPSLTGPKTLYKTWILLTTPSKLCKRYAQLNV